MANQKLQKIAEKYAAVNFNEENYNIGGGLSDSAFASRRHQDAKNDPGKLTEGAATQLFKKATGKDTDYVKAVLNYAVPNMEWHHAGKLPKAYGGGMKKTYFLNAAEIVDVANNWQSYCEKYEISIVEAQKAEEAKKSLEQRKHDFLVANAKHVVRVAERPNYFYQTAQEMHGKYGWFDSRYKSYNLPEYYTGWEFETAEKLTEFYQLK